MTTIQPCMEYNETYNRDDAVELLHDIKGGETEKGAITPDVRFNRSEWAKDIRFSRDITCLEFAFKPMRLIWVDFPGKNGQIEKKPVWYMIYTVRNLGDSLRTTVEKNDKINDEVEFPEQTTFQITPCPCSFCTRDRASGADRQLSLHESPLIRNQVGFYQPKKVALPFQFAPVFIIASDNVVEKTDTTVNLKTGRITSMSDESQVVFQDQVIPLALSQIVARENPPQKLETSVSMAKTPIQPGETRWGVATWVDVDPKINQFWVDVSGLTNAYRWENVQTEEGQPIRKADEKLTRESLKNRRDFERKTLRLYFWRPGDEFSQDERQFRYGGKPGEKTNPYDWVYLYVNQ